MESTDAQPVTEIVGDAVPPVSTVVAQEMVPANENMEDLNMSSLDGSVPVLPVTVPATGGYGAGPCYLQKGLEGKDAAFIAGLASEVGHRDNIRDTLENRFHVERLGRDLETSQHRLELSNKKFLSEMTALIKEENAKTRDLMEATEKKKLQDQVGELKTMLCVLQNKPTAVVPAVPGTSTIH